MFKHTKKILLGTAVVAMMAAGGMAQAGSPDFIDHEFVSHQTSDLGDRENLDLNRYLNYEHREACQNYRKPPSPFHRTGCDLWRGQRLDYTIYFDTASSAIRGGEQATINKIASAIKKHKPREVLIVGHTDTQGSASYNEELSMRRAASVSDALARKGVSSTIIDGDAEGEDRLAVQTEDGVAHQSNRRVTVLLVK